MSKLKVLIGAIVGVVVLVVGGTFVYINFIQDDAPEKLSLDSTTGTTVAGQTTTTAGTLTTTDGNWKPSGDSIVGYRAKEVLFGQSTEAVGRTSKVTGSMTIAGAKVTAAEFTVDMTTVKSDRSQRDGQFQGRIMNTAKFPTSTFKLTAPIDLGSVPAAGAEISATATGDLTLHGTTKSVTFPVKAKLDGTAIKVNGSIPIVFSDYTIPAPSFGPAEVQDHGELEMLLVFTQG